MHAARELMISAWYGYCNKGCRHLQALDTCLDPKGASHGLMFGGFLVLQILGQTWYEWDSEEVAAGGPMLGSNSFPIPNSWAYFLGFDAIREPKRTLVCCHRNGSRDGT